MEILLIDVITVTVVIIQVITTGWKTWEVLTAGHSDDRCDDMMDEHLLSCPRVWPSPATSGVVVGSSSRLG